MKPEETPTIEPVTQRDNSVSVRASSLDEAAAYLSAMRAPNVFDTRAPFIVVPNSLKVINVEEHMPIPARIRKNIMFSETASFIEYFKLFKDSYKPRIFSNISNNGITFKCVFDYDGEGITVEGGTSAPRPQWNDHIANLMLTYHRDYAVLRHNSDKWFAQEDFALFIEENMHLFKSPDAATMLELAQELKGYRNVGWKSGKRLANGKVTLEFIEEIDAKTTKGDIQVPESLVLTSPIFDGFAVQTINAAFRYRLDGSGGILFSYRLLTKLAERAAEEEVVKSIKEATGHTIYAVSTFNGITTIT